MTKIKRKYKTVVQRCAAAFIDGVIFFPISMVFDRLADPNDKPAYAWWNFLYYCIWLTYAVYMHGKYGQTLGKMASTIKVYSLDEKSLIGYPKAFLREIIWFGTSILGLMYVLFRPGGDANDRFLEFTLYPSLVSTVLEIVTMFLNPRRRALHDLIAGSVVLDITKYRKWDFEFEESLDNSDKA